MSKRIPTNPPAGERVVAIRESGARLIARLDYKPCSTFRDPKRLHWLNNDDKFIDVGFDRVVGWEPLVGGVDGNPRRCKICGRLIPNQICDMCRRCEDFWNLMMPLMRNETAKAYIMAQFLDAVTADELEKTSGNSGNSA